MTKFEYLIDKIETAPKSIEPFEHIYIDNFFMSRDFEEIVNAPEISVPCADDDSHLFTQLYRAGYKIIDFPGCTADQDTYIKWHQTKARDDFRFSSSCEGFGITMRLVKPQTKILDDLKTFLASDRFNQAISERLGLDLATCSVDGGIQKYLDGYEISPHPDIRRKAATFMVNINPHGNSEEVEHHTHYMSLKPEYEYVRKFWERNQGVERCWIPWDWCVSTYTQVKNNSIVIFAPSERTIHAVKANYDHLAGQRTQLYGNLWFKTAPMLRPLTWEELDGGKISLNAESLSAKMLARKLLPTRLQGIARQIKQTITAAGDNQHRRKF